MPPKKHKFAYDDIYLHTEEQALELILERPEQFYVYVLINPLNNLPFYVGKGQGNRCFKHWNDNSHSDILNSFINRLSKKVENILYVFELFTNNENEAYEAETNVIVKYKLKKDKGLLYNSTYGYGTKSYSRQRSEVIDWLTDLYGKAFTYDNLLYKGVRSDFTITCPIHGDLSVSYIKLHRGTYVCPDCDNLSKKSKYLKIFKEKHGDCYDYCLFEFNGATTKSAIICKFHNKVFYQSPDKHGRGGRGCPDCGIAKLGSNTRSSLSDWIISSNIKHNNKYSYSKSNYINARTHILVTCPIHGDFYTHPWRHANKGQGCPECK